MANNFRTPGVYVQEISKLPPSIAAVETAIPAFIGYTEKAELNDDVDFFLNKPVRIKSLNEYEQIFGGAFDEPFGPSTTAKIVVQENQDSNGDPTGTFTVTSGLTNPGRPSFFLYYSLQLYFANGGGPCYIVSVGLYTTNGITNSVDETKLEGGIAALVREDEPTMIVIPDASGIKPADSTAASVVAAESKFYGVFQAALAQCKELKDRVAIVDVFDGDQYFLQPGGPDVINGDGDGSDKRKGLRGAIGINFLDYGTAYYPWLQTTLSYHYDASKVHVEFGSSTAEFLHLPEKLDDGSNNPAFDATKSLYHVNNAAYQKIVDEIDKFSVVLPPSGIMAGIYALVDSTRGVWKAPANVSISGVSDLTVQLDDGDQDLLNVHETGKSVNAIRKFRGKGIIVWGARTLDGNDNEWRYISVRRFFNFAEESIKKGTEQFVFEPNDRNTWTKVRGMIENFLLLQWRAGALAGATPEEAFFVKVGLPETMTSLDILEGRMNVEIGMAVVRPAEFIILKFSHKMQES